MLQRGIVNWDSSEGTFSLAPLCIFHFQRTAGPLWTSLFGCLIIKVSSKAHSKNKLPTLLLHDSCRKESQNTGSAQSICVNLWRNRIFDFLERACLLNADKTGSILRCSTWLCGELFGPWVSVSSSIQKGNYTFCLFFWIFWLKTAIILKLYKKTQSLDRN